MKKGLIYLVLTSLLMLFAQNAKATHAMGGEIVYRSLGNNDYLVTVKLYRDCSGFLMSTSTNLKLKRGPSLIHTFSLPLISTSQLVTNCQGNTVCMGGNLPGYEEYIYEDTISVVSNWSYVMVAEVCCRNTAITNLTDPDAHVIYLTTTLDNSIVPSNSSPYFTYPPSIILGAGMSAQLMFGTYDIDYDSIAYEMVQPLSDSVNVVPYAPGFSIDSPFVSSTPFLFDPLTGVLKFTPVGQQNAVISVLVKEYRFGQLIGTTRRDIQLVIINTSNNRPVLDVPAGEPVNNILYVCVGDTFDLEVFASDPDTGQTVRIGVLPSHRSTLSNNNTTQASAKFNWAPTIHDVSARPYTFTVRADDSGCPPATAFNTYQVYVTTCYSDVWPGDANADFIADHYDILNIGRAWHYTGTGRVNATTNWVAQSSRDWSGAFVSGLNHKHADCNGDGVVDSLDLDVITLNFGQTHLKANAPSKVGVPMSVVSPADTFEHGNMVELPITLGDSSELATDVFGVAFTVNYALDMFDASTLDVDFADNWLANGNDEAVTYFKHDEVNGKVHIAIARKDQTDLTGSGVVCTLRLNIKTGLPFAYIARDITVRGTVLQDLAENDMSVRELDAEVISMLPMDSNTVGIKEPVFQLGVYPNPASSSVTVNSNAVLSKLMVYSLAGEQIRNYKAPQIPEQIQVSDLENGVYLISAETTAGKRTYARFVKMDR